jgi:hypothetical protein
MTFFKNGGKEDKTGPPWRLVPVRGFKEKCIEGECGGNIMYS